MTMQNLLMQHILILRNLKSTMKMCFSHWVWNMELLLVNIRSMTTVRFLIEMNCRVLGAIQKYTLLDDAWGEHHTAISLELYLNPEECIKKAN